MRCRQHVEEANPWDTANFASICDDILSVIEGADFHTPFGVNCIRLGKDCIVALNRRLFMRRMQNEFPAITFQDAEGEPITAVWRGNDIDQVWHGEVAAYCAFKAGRGSGKTETARRFIEQLAEHGQPMNRKQRRKAAREAKR